MILSPDILKANTTNLETYTTINKEINNELNNLFIINFIGFAIVGVFIIISIIYIVKSKKSKFFKIIIGLLLIIIPLIILLIINLFMLNL